MNGHQEGVVCSCGECGTGRGHSPKIGMSVAPLLPYKALPQVSWNMKGRLKFSTVQLMLTNDYLKPGNNIV
jgi:hypothetical protein